MNSNNKKTVLHIGFGNVVLADRVIAIVCPESAPVKRIVSAARESGVLVDVTHGRRARAVILTDGEYIFLSSLQPETLSGRISQSEIPKLMQSFEADEEI